MKKFLTAILAATMLLGLMGFTVFAEETTIEGQNISLDGNHYGISGVTTFDSVSLKVNDAKWGIYVNTGTTEFNLKNSTVEINNSSSTAIYNESASYVNITLDNSRIIINGSGTGINLANITLKNGSTIEINNASIGINSGSVSVDGTSSVTVSDGSSHGITNVVLNVADNGKVKVSNCAFLGLNIQDGSSIGENATVTVTDCGKSGNYVGIPMRINGTVENFENILVDNKQIVAQGNKGNAFTSVEDAVNAAASGDTITLLSDIDLGNDPWTPLTLPENVNFDGNNKTIKNLKITGGDNAAFFASVTGKSVVENLIFENVDVTGGANVATLVGSTINSCRYENIKVTGDIKIEGNYKVGGIIGGGYFYADGLTVEGDGTGTITGVYKEGDNTEGDNIGGIAGFIGEGKYTVANCNVSGVTIAGTRKVGGIIGSAFQDNSIDGATVDNVTVSTNATAEYAADNAKTMGVGGIVGLYTKNGDNNGTVTNVVISDVELTNENNVNASMGYVTGGLRGADGDDKPVAPSETVTISKIEIDAACKGATVDFMSPDSSSDIAWTTDKDAGYYVEANTTYGMIRFLFKADLSAETVVDSFGIKYSKASDITEEITQDNKTVSETGNQKAFYGDLIGIKENAEDTYYAIAYVTVGETTYWSDIISYTPDWTKKFTNYEPKTVGGAE